MEKQKKVNFLKGSRALKSRELEQLVHTNLWGTSSVPSLGDSWYYLIFTDEYNKKVWVYFLKLKFDVFKKWKALVETKTFLKLKCLRFDNDGEYIDGGFKEYCAARYQNAEDHSWDPTIE